MNGTNASTEGHRSCRPRLTLAIRIAGVTVMLVGAMFPIPHRMWWVWAGVVILVISGMLS